MLVLLLGLGVFCLPSSVNAQTCDYCLQDSYGYEWCLNKIGQDSKGIYMQGTCDTGSLPLKDAMASYLKNNRGVRMNAYGGATGLIFTYNWQLVGSSGSGVWIRQDGSHDQVDVSMCSASAEAKPKSEGPAPDERQSFLPKCMS